MAFPAASANLPSPEEEVGTNLYTMRDIHEMGTNAVAAGFHVTDVPVVIHTADEDHVNMRGHIVHISSSGPEICSKSELEVQVAPDGDEVVPVRCYTGYSDAGLQVVGKEEWKLLPDGSMSINVLTSAQLPFNDGSKVAIIAYQGDTIISNDGHNECGDMIIIQLGDDVPLIINPADVTLSPAPYREQLSMTEVKRIGYKTFEYACVKSEYSVFVVISIDGVVSKVSFPMPTTGEIANYGDDMLKKLIDGKLTSTSYLPAAYKPLVDGPSSLVDGVRAIRASGRHQ